MVRDNRKSGKGYRGIDIDSARGYVRGSISSTCSYVRHRISERNDMKKAIKEILWLLSSILILPIYLFAAALFLVFWTFICFFDWLDHAHTDRQTKSNLF